MALGTGGFSLPVGASRIAHVVYPPTFGTGRQDNASSGTSVLVRVGTGTSGVALSIAGSGTSTTLATNGVNSPNNAVPVRLRTTAIASDLAQLQFGAAAFPICERQSALVGQPSLVYRLIVVAAFQPLPGPIAANTDLGLEILPGNVSNLNVGATRPGVIFGPTDVATFGLRIRNSFGGAYTLDRELAFAACGISNVLDFNVYELRLVSSAGPAGGALKAFINGQQFGASVDLSTAAGIMPVLSAAGGGFNGFNFRITNGNVGNTIAGTYDMFYNEAHLICTSTEDMSG